MMRRISFLLIILLLISTFAGCGQKGNLYMEGHEPRSQMGAVKAKQRREAKEAQKQAEENQKNAPSASQLPAKPKSAVPAKTQMPSNEQPKPYEEGSTPNPAKHWVTPVEKAPDLEPSAPN